MAWIFTTDGNYVNFNGGGNLWRLHKDSNCISWHWDETGDLFFDVYDQEYTVKAGNIADVIIDGTPLSAASGFPAAITAAFTGIGTQLVLSKTVTLTDAQIKALPTNYIEVVPAIANKFIQFISASVVFNVLAGAYTNKDPNHVLQIVFGDWDADASTIFDLSFGNSIFNLTLSPATRNSTKTGYEAVSESYANAGADMPLKIIAENALGNFTGGNAANTLKVTVYYVVVDL